MPQAGNSALRKAREDQGLTPRDVANRLGVHIDTYRRWELNAQQPSMRHMGQLCQLFKKSVEELGYIHFFD